VQWSSVDVKGNVEGGYDPSSRASNARQAEVTIGWSAGPEGAAPSGAAPQAGQATCGATCVPSSSMLRSRSS
jgi:hypothetical protein